MAVLWQETLVARWFLGCSAGASLSAFALLYFLGNMPVSNITPMVGLPGGLDTRSVVVYDCPPLQNAACYRCLQRFKSGPCDRDSC